MKHTLFKWLTIWFLISQLFPPYAAFVPINGALALAVFCGVAIVLFPNLLKSRCIFWLLVYHAICLLQYMFGNAFYPTIKHVLPPLLTMLSAMLLIEYMYRYDYNCKLTKIIFFESLSLNVIMTFLTLPQLAINPNIIRAASILMEDGGEETQMLSFLMSYDNIHGLTFLFAPLAAITRMFFQRDKKKNGVVLGLITLLLLYIVFRSNATTPLILSIGAAVGGVLFWGSRIDRKIINKVLLIGILALAFLNKPVLVGVIDYAQSFMSVSDANYQKMDELRAKLLTGRAEGDWGYREKLYDTSSKLFLESPIIGTSTPDKVSRHSFIVDRLALMGILGVIPLALFFLNAIKDSARRLNESKITYYVSIMILFVMLCLKNEFGFGTWLYGFCLLPVYCRYIDYLIANE